MGPEVVVVVPPGFQFLAGMSEAGEDRLVQELGDCQDFRVWPGIMGNKESHYVTTQRTCHTE